MPTSPEATTARPPRRRSGAAGRLALRLGLLVLSPLIVLLAIECVWHLIGDPRHAAYEAALAARPPHFQLARRGLLRGDDDPAVSFTMTPGFRAEVGGNVYRINEHGMRGGPVAVAKPAGIRRVLVLGDSYAFGFGVAEEATIAAQLQARLAPLHRGIEVLNMGVPGYQTGQQEAILTRDGLRFDPDLVVLVYYANDNIEPAFLYDPRIKGPYVDALPLSYDWKRFLARSILYGKLAKAHANHLTTTGALDSTGARHWPVTRARLTRIAAVLARRKIGFVLAAIPALVNSTDFVDGTNVFNRDHDRLLAFAREQDIAVADFRAALLERGQPIELLFVSRDPPDSHLTGTGYGILADRIVAQIRAHGMLQ